MTLLRLLELTDTITIGTRTSGGPWRPVFVWSAVAADRAYLRSAFGPASGWFRRAVAAGELALDVGAEPDDTEAPPPAHLERPVVLGCTLLPDDAVHARELDAVDGAFTRKYGHDPANLAPVLSTAARACTLRLRL